MIKDSSILFTDEIYMIVGASMSVSKELGSGFIESVYQEALEIEFKNSKIPYETQKELEISYKGIKLKKGFFADFLCFEKIIVEIKAIKSITTIEKAQILNYLKASSLSVGLIINFGNPKLEWKRFIKTY